MRIDHNPSLLPSKPMSTPNEVKPTISVEAGPEKTPSLEATPKVPDVIVSKPTPLNDLISMYGDANQPADDAPSTGASITLESLMGAFGESGGPHDLTGDGVVNVDDLLEFLAGMDESPEQFDSLLDMQPHVDPNPTDGTITLQGLLDAFGQTGSPYDLNGDDMVDVSDLLQFLADQKPPAEDEGPKPGHVVRAFFAKLNAEGYTDQPPANLKELVDALDLGPSRKAYLMQRLEQRWPQGLGVNALG